MSGEASFTSAPRRWRISRGPNSSNSSKPSVAMISTLEPEIFGIDRSFFNLAGTGLPCRPLSRSMPERKQRLRHASDNEAGYSRKRMGRYWAYFDENGERVTDRDTI